jgi:hypothetical protein
VTGVVVCAVALGASALLIVVAALLAAGLA